MITLQRLLHENESVAEDYPKKWISWQSRSHVVDIIKLAKTIKSHIDNICRNTIGINSSGVESLNNEIRTAFKRSYRFKSREYRCTIIYPVIAGVNLPTGW